MKLVLVPTAVRVTASWGDRWAHWAGSARHQTWPSGVLFSGLRSSEPAAQFPCIPGHSSMRRPWARESGGCSCVPGFPTWSCGILGQVTLFCLPLSYFMCKLRKTVAGEAVGRIQRSDAHSYRTLTATGL